MIALHSPIDFPQWLPRVFNFILLWSNITCYGPSTETSVKRTCVRTTPTLILHYLPWAARASFAASASILCTRAMTPALKTPSRARRGISSTKGWGEQVLAIQERGMSRVWNAEDQMSIINLKAWQSIRDHQMSRALKYLCLYSWNR